MMAAVAKTPVYLLTGFLGSGKTTLLNAALRSPELANTAVIVNELGEIGLDHLLIARASDNIVLLDGGCLCCAISDSLHETLADLDYRRTRGEVPCFERIVVETSGAADPAPLLNILLGHRLVTERFALEATVCVVDAQHFLSQRSEHAELDKQLAVAEQVAISKADLAGPEMTRTVNEAIVQVNPMAQVQESILGSAAAAMFAPLPASRYRWRPASGARTRIGVRGSQPHAHESRIHAYSFRPARPVTWAGWAAWSRLVAARFGERLIRVKGLMCIDDTAEIVFVQGVQGVFHPPARFTQWPDADHSNRLVCIGRDLCEEELRLTLGALAAPAGTQPDFYINTLHEEQQRS